MYMYYGLAALGPGMTKYLWWKRYLTSLQLVSEHLNCVFYNVSVSTGCNGVWLQVPFLLVICQKTHTYIKSDPDCFWLAVGITRQISSMDAPQLTTGPSVCLILLMNWQNMLLLCDCSI